MVSFPKELGDDRQAWRLARLALLSWLAMLGCDFFLHAGALSRFYLRPSPFLLPPLEAFRLIPVGYLSFLLLTILLLWLMLKLNLAGRKAGFLFGLKVGALVWGSFVLGLLSISTAESGLLASWFFGQTLELAIGGVVLGEGLAKANLGRLFIAVLVLVIGLVSITLILQILGIAPAAHL